jgi:hypothetical protein
VTSFARHNTAELLQFEMEEHDDCLLGFVIASLAFFCWVSGEMCGCNAVVVKSVPCSLPCGPFARDCNMCEPALLAVFKSCVVVTHKEGLGWTGVCKMLLRDTSPWCVCNLAALSRISWSVRYTT